MTRTGRRFELKSGRTLWILRTCRCWNFMQGRLPRRSCPFLFLISFFFCYQPPIWPKVIDIGLLQYCLFMEEEEGAITSLPYLVPLMYRSESHSVTIFTSDDTPALYAYQWRHTRLICIPVTTHPLAMLTSDDTPTLYAYQWRHTRLICIPVTTHQPYMLISDDTPG